MTSDSVAPLPKTVASRLRVHVLAAILLAYVACLTAATYPRVLHLASGLPAVPDPVTHLWTLRWYRTCLLEGKSVFFLPDIQAPVGAPLGLVPPLHLQAIMYVPLSLVISNDVLCYNIIWIAEFLMTALGTFALAYHVTRSTGASFIAGLLAMLSGPMMMHAHGHIELMALGFVPLFLLAWLRLVDQPSWKRLAVAAGLYLLVVMSAAYFALLVTIPAALYVVGRAIRLRERAWILQRARWLSGFVTLTLPCVLALFSSQIWAARSGQVMTRPRSEFISYGAPPWSYVVPTAEHLIHRLMPRNLYAEGRIPLVESSSYLGIVAIALVLYSAVARAKFPRRAYWWTGLAVLMVFSWGAFLTIGGARVRMPALWLWQHVKPFQAIRVPARFNLFAAIFAAIVAAAGLKQLLTRIPRPAGRAAVLAVLATIAVVDLGIRPFPSVPLPRMPACYAMIRQRDPAALILELPQFPSGAAAELNAMAAYWQSFHRIRTTAGYGAHSNDRFDFLLGLSTPFNAYDLVDPNFLAYPDAGHVAINTHIPMADYAWLYLKTFGIDYVVLHRWAGCESGLPIHREAMEAILRPALIYEDADTLVYESKRLPEPTRPVMLCGEGWRRMFFWKSHLVRAVGRDARMEIYSPSPETPVAIWFEAAALRSARTVRLREGGRILAEWTVPADTFTTVSSPPVALEKGFHTLVIESDRDETPRRHRDLPTDGDKAPYSLRVTQVRLLTSPVVAESAPPSVRR